MNLIFLSCVLILCPNSPGIADRNGRNPIHVACDIGNEVKQIYQGLIHAGRNNGHKIFETDTETFFETTIFEADSETFFEIKIFDTDAETFSRN